MNRNTVYGIQVLVGVFFLIVGGAKLAGADLTVRQFEMIGLGQGFRLITGTFEVIGGLCLFVPRVAIYGTLMVCGLLVASAGAMVAQVGQVALGPMEPPVRPLVVSRMRQASLDRNGAPGETSRPMSVHFYTDLAGRMSAACLRNVGSEGSRRGARQEAEEDGSGA